MILSILLWLIRKHPDVAGVSVTLFSDVEHMRLETHEWSFSNGAN